MICFDHITKENIKESNPIWSQILNHACGILILRNFGSVKKCMT